MKHLPRKAYRLIVSAWLLTTAPWAIAAEQATVYKCIHSDGRIVFSDEPCNGEMEVQTVTAPEAGSGGEAARKGIEQMAREYEARREAERKATERAREEARRRALEERLANPEVTVITPWRDGGYYPRGYPLAPYDRYRDRSHGGLQLSDDGLSLWFGQRYPLPRHYPPHHQPRVGDRDHPPRDPYSADGKPIKEPGYSGRYPGGFPGYR
ncbi:DUF4124 domain-containing protein [Guyparkeria hydrothermalis]|uniref:DUF4124 domain-containing protein n=1 Tax=Guyparkeria hydrothermalis TaxID=923 RepID=UPI0020210857|nr:DUF4124 domain-containing protein [Guyparkeria hydrothermalis]MCL7745134.1 DUF4124 domain-containing protein [Guyparkeria hydrothermalis]